MSTTRAQEIKTAVGIVAEMAAPLSHVRAKGAIQPFDTVGFIMAYEAAGELDEEQIIEGFQHLTDTGIIYSLQGSYQRTAIQLILSGKIK